MTAQTEIISFYEFKDMRSVGDLIDLRASIRQLLIDLDLLGTIILADEGFNGMVCGSRADIAKFIEAAGSRLKTSLDVKSSLSAHPPFRRVDVKIKPEVVTLKKPVDMALGNGTHVRPENWNHIINDPETLVLDTRNDYEYTTGTFLNSVNPAISKFSDLPAYIAEHVDPRRHKRVAMFCTGGIRCEKFAPYLKQQGFQEVYQLEGGILRYLETIPAAESLWQGECFVFDDRISVDHDLQRGVEHDHSQDLRAKDAKKAQE